MTDREAIDVLFNEWKCIDRNDGIHCDRKCESCDLVIDVEIIREAYNMAISALQAQDPKTRKICDTCKHDPPSEKWPCVYCDWREPADRWEPKDVPDTNVGDTVSRKEAIDALMDEFKRVPTTAIRAKNRIERLPSVQPEQTRTQMSLANCISRQAAIDAFYQYPNINWTTLDVLKKINDLPPAQPEPLTASIDYELSKDECDRLKQAMSDAPIMLLPSAQPDRCDTCRFVYYPKETNNNDQ